MRVFFRFCFAGLFLAVGCQGPRPYVEGEEARLRDPAITGSTEAPAYQAQGMSWQVRTAAGIVRRIQLPDGDTISLQVTDAQLPPREYLYRYELTIGKFSRILGSGFTRSRNHIYHARIGGNGTDTFQYRGVRYRVSWRVPWERGEAWVLKNAFEITLEEIIPEPSP